MEYTVYLSTGSVDVKGNYNRDYAEIFRAPSRDGAMAKARKWLRSGWSAFEGKLPEWVKVTHTVRTWRRVGLWLSGQRTHRCSLP